MAEPLIPTIIDLAWQQPILVLLTGIGLALLWGMDRITNFVPLPMTSRIRLSYVGLVLLATSAFYLFATGQNLAGAAASSIFTGILIAIIFRVAGVGL